MVTRKPVNSPTQASSTSPTSPRAPGLPYPTSSAGPEDNTMNHGPNHDAPGFDLIDLEDHRKIERRDSDVSSHGTWDSDGPEEEDADDFVEIPKPLNVKPSHQDMRATKEDANSEQSHLPAILRPGHTGGSIAIPRRTTDMRQYDEEAQENPWKLEEQSHPLAGSFLQQNQHPVGPPVLDMPSFPSQDILEDNHVPPTPSHAPPPPPVPSSQPASSGIPSILAPADGMAKLSINGKVPVETAPSYQIAEVLPVPQQGRTPYPSSPSAASPSAVEPPEFPSNNPWRAQSSPEKHEQSYLPPPGPPPKTPASPITYQQPQYAPPSGPPPGSAGTLIDHDEPFMSQSSPQQPPRVSPIVTSGTDFHSTDSIPETPGTRTNRQRNEHYQIKHINWFDRTSMRRSPILTQNANGPCPLLALVNALVLSTPPNQETALIETLRTREQVSLGLLLDAVFDELMSGRRGNTAHELPDVSELYSFLLALHTGMNVNPRFIDQVASQGASFNGHSLSNNGLSQDKAGCFEQTKEMRLYSTFSIPLIHGWLPGKASPAYAAFERNAQTFEDAQNIQFVEPELEDKANHEGLGPEEQQSLMDIRTIKQFLANWPTQLTEYGLETISAVLAPGETAILFRNDHFSTLYKEPRHGALMTLVTDAGYGSHDEIVWESLVDVNGAASEMFSGDFRLVSHSEEARLNQSSSAGGQEGWQTVGNRRNNRNQLSSASDEVPPPLPGPRPTNVQSEHGGGGVLTEAQRKAAEQEDHDLALALQLQEEEEDRHRQDEDRRRREQELSEQFLENEERPPVPPRRGAGRTTSTNAITPVPVTGPTTTTTATPMTGRAPVNRPADSSNPDAPPTYEQSASDQPYRPAGSTAPTAQGNPLDAYDALRRQQTAYAQQSTATLNDNAPPYSPTSGRRRSDQNRVRRRSSGMGNLTPGLPGRVPQAATVKQAEDERCVIM